MINKQVIKAWNSGLTVSEAEKIYNTSFEVEFKELEKVYGCGSIPMSDFPGHKRCFNRQENLSEEYKVWKGISGPGLVMREICKALKTSGDV